jgi:hypothetical protein
MRTTEDTSEKKMSARNDIELLNCDSITDGQIDAALVVCELVDVFREQLTNTRQLAGGERIREPWRVPARTRPMRVLLIEGKRGAGKTSLLHTILEAWRAGELLPGKDPSRTNNSDHQLPLNRTDKLNTYFKKHRGHVIPIGVLELPTVSEEATLSFQILGQFRHIVEYLVKSECQRDSKDPNDTDLKKAFGKLLEAALVDAKGMVSHICKEDLEDARYELDRIEQERLELDTTFSSFCNQLVKDFAALPQCHEHGTSDTCDLPLFVIAIDDADLHSTFTINALNLLRKLHHPNVMFLLTGDITMFEYSLQCELMENHPRKEPLPYFQHVVPQILEKLLPEAHRAVLKELTPADAESVLDRLGAWDCFPPLWRNFFDYDLVEPAFFELLPRNIRMLTGFGEFVKKRGDIAQHTESDGVIANWIQDIFGWMDQRGVSPLAKTVTHECRWVAVSNDIINNDSKLRCGVPLVTLASAAASESSAGSVDFRGADLRGADFRGVNFGHAPPGWLSSSEKTTKDARLRNDVLTEMRLWAFIIEYEGHRWPSWTMDTFLDSCKRARDDSIASRWLGSNVTGEEQEKAYVRFYLEVCGGPRFREQLNDTLGLYEVGNFCYSRLKPPGDFWGPPGALLLAAPESGLSSDVCAELLTGVGDDEPKLEALRAWRRTFYGTPKPDGQDNAHPWYRKVDPKANVPRA